MIPAQLKAIEAQEKFDKDDMDTLREMVANSHVFGVGGSLKLERPTGEDLMPLEYKLWKLHKAGDEADREKVRKMFAESKDAATEALMNSPGPSREELMSIRRWLGREEAKQGFDPDETPPLGGEIGMRCGEYPSTPVREPERTRTITINGQEFPMVGTWPGDQQVPKWEANGLYVPPPIAFNWPAWPFWLACAAMLLITFILLLIAACIHDTSGNWASCTGTFLACVGSSWKMWEASK